ncbi:MmcQ/YjbR family DNA-binding protein [Paenibacillus sp. sptzw28]|uniref:MmcQ/YjbR family DNA-binding protein n=1 Tax=Paenibacillus sp. sptzw28 TaxID=715179 RepID=UPI001C6F3A8D|nr:MmcQ/YjbR family DNA-binding protein [Paenibacillus sp. sptzw28]QYR23300.1 MmcQ/YjbR family DNA-binding protein [Paenibacillus sp. sptzw28]
MVNTDVIRSLALALPKTEEREHWGKPSFRVQSKIFAVVQPDGVSLLIKTTKEEQIAYTTMAPDIFRLPDGFANMNFVVLRMDRIDPAELHDLLIMAWKLAAPKQLVKAFNELGKKADS